jgi:hypothetical protein
MRKKMIILVATILLSTQATAEAGNGWEPGGPMNPYVIQKKGDNRTEMTTEQMDWGKSIYAPGQPTNPYIIRKDRQGRTTIQTDIPDYDSGGEDDD